MSELHYRRQRECATRLQKNCKEIIRVNRVAYRTVMSAVQYLFIQRCPFRMTFVRHAGLVLWLCLQATFLPYLLYPDLALLECSLILPVSTFPRLSNQTSLTRSRRDESRIFSTSPQKSLATTHLLEDNVALDS